MTWWLLGRTTRDDPRGVLAIALVAFLSACGLALVLGVGLSSEVTARSDSRTPPVDIGPVAVATAMSAGVVLVRLVALVSRGAERTTALLSASGASPAALVRIERTAVLTAACIGVAAASPVAPFLVIFLAPGFSGAVAPSPLLAAAGSLSWVAGGGFVVGVVLLAVRRTAAQAAARPAALVLRGAGADEQATTVPWAGRVLLVAGLWLLVVVPVFAVVVLWGAAEDAVTAHPEVFDAADQAAFAELDLFTPALRIVALHATVAVVGVVSLVALLPAVAPGLVRGWTRIVPQGRGVVWRLVRARAASATIANVSSIMTVGLFTGLVVSLSSTFDLGRMVGAVPDVGRASLWSDAATSLGPAAIVAMAGAWATTLLHSPRRDPDSQFLSAHGASSSVITLVTLIQAIVAVLTVAAPVALLSVGSMTTSLVIAWSTGVAVTPRVPDVVPIAGAIVISFIALAGGARAARWCASAPRTRSATARATAPPSRR